MKKAMTRSLIAPCGMNCGICLGYLREEDKCPTCNASDVDAPINCERNGIKGCEKLKSIQSNLCIECDDFPCSRIHEIDERYRKNYNMSMIDNLRVIKESGMDAFLQSEQKRWTCDECGGTVCVHRGYCLACGE